MIIKDFLFKLKTDLKSLRRYPAANLAIDSKPNYEKYWAVRRGANYRPVLSGWQKQRADFLIKMIEPGSTVVDLGCGDGLILKYLAEKIGIKPIGVDFSAPVIDAANNEGIKIIEGDVSSVDFLKTLPECDYCLGLEILEHMAYPEEIVLIMAEKAKKGLIFSFPNTGYYLHRLRLLLGQFPLQWIIPPGEHLRYWTVRDVKYWVRSLGFKLDKLIVYEGLPGLKTIWPSMFAQGIIIKISL